MQGFFCLILFNCCWQYIKKNQISSVHGYSPGKNTGVGCHTLLQGIFPTQRSPGLPHYRQILSLLTKPPGKPRDIGVGSLSLLQGIFLTQESNWGFLHCRQTFFFLTSWATREASFISPILIIKKNWAHKRWFAQLFLLSKWYYHSSRSIGLEL